MTTRYEMEQHIRRRMAIVDRCGRWIVRFAIVGLVVWTGWKLLRGLL